MTITFGHQCRTRKKVSTRLAGLSPLMGNTSPIFSHLLRKTGGHSVQGIRQNMPRPRVCLGSLASARETSNQQNGKYTWILLNTDGFWPMVDIHDSNDQSIKKHFSASSLTTMPLEDMFDDSMGSKHFRVESSWHPSSGENLVTIFSTDRSVG